MAKRDLFGELMQGMDELQAEREGKLTLKTIEVQKPRPINMAASRISQIRKAHNCSQSVFARLLSINVSTLRNWEQGRAKPNDQAKLLLQMVDRVPGTLDTLASIIGGNSKQVTSGGTIARTRSKTTAAGKKAAAKSSAKTRAQKVAVRKKTARKAAAA